MEQPLWVNAEANAEKHIDAVLSMAQKFLWVYLFAQLKSNKKKINVQGEEKRPLGLLIT